MTIDKAKVIGGAVIGTVSAFAAAIFFGMIAISAIVRGYALSWLWYWFAVPLGAPSINIPIAIGFSLIAGMLTAQLPPNFKKELLQPRKWYEIATAFFSPFFVLLLGYVAHLYV